MPEPIVTDISVSRTKISDEDGYNVTDVSFRFDVPVMEYTINVNGVSNSTGVVAGHGSKYIDDAAEFTIDELALKTVDEIRRFAENVSIEDQIDYTELYQEGDNRINIYGKSLDGTWSSYNQT